MTITRSLTAGVDAFVGAIGDDNFFEFTPTTLQATDTITGDTTVGSLDVMVATDAGTVTAAQFAGVTSIEELRLSASGNAVTLTNSLVAGTSRGYFLVTEAGGDNLVDASGITKDTRIVFAASSGSDTLTGGSGSDVFLVAPSNLTAADTIIGGSGFDYIEFGQAGTVASSALANVSGIEALVFDGAGNSVTLADALVDASDTGQFTVSTLGGNNTIDGSGLTSTRTLIFNASTGADTFKGHLGNDVVVFTNPSDLTSADSVTGGAGINSLIFVNSGTVAASSFANVTGIETIVLQGTGQNISLTNGLVGGSTIGSFVLASFGDNTIDGSAVNNGMPLLMIDDGGNQTFKGSAGADGFLFDASQLSSGDTVQGAGGSDTIYLTSGGAVAASAFANVSSVEALVLLGGTDANITLSNTSVATSGVGNFFVVDNGHDNTIDATGVTATGITIQAGAGNDTFKGGGGNDVFTFAAADLTAADTVSGAAGSDTLVIKTNGHVTAANTAGVSGIEVVQLAAGGEFDFANTLSSAGAAIAVGSAAADTFDASAVTGYFVQMFGNGGADTMIGGSKDDIFVVPDSNFTSIDGNGGNDTLTISGSQTFDLQGNASKLHNIEVINLDNTVGTAITFSTEITAADVGTISSNNALYIVGGLNDSVYESPAWGAVQNQVVGGPTAATAGIIFNHYHDSTTGADLFVANNLVQIEPDPMGPDIFLGGLGMPNFTPSTYGTGNAAGVAIAAPNAVLDDPDTSGVSAQVGSLKVAISDPHSASAEFLSINSTGHTLLASHPELTITGEGTSTLQISGNAADTVYQSLLRDIVYVNNDVSGSLNTADRHITVDSKDGSGLSAVERTATVHLTNGDPPPVFDSPASASTPENVAATTPVYTAHATEAGPRTIGYSLASGGDNDLFHIDASNGAVTFNNSPDFEAPLDANHDNQYDITVLASDGLPAHDATLNVAITVSDLLFA